MATQDINVDNSTASYDDCFHLSVFSGHSNANDWLTNRNNANGGSTADSGTFYYAGYARFFNATPVTYRAFQAFNVGNAGIDTSATVSAVSLKLVIMANTTGFVTYTNEGNTHICNHDAASTVYTQAACFGSLVGRPSSGTYSGNVTEYASAFSNSAGTHNISFNSNGISAVQALVSAGSSTGNLTLGLLNSVDFAGSGYDTGLSGGVVIRGAKFETGESGTSANRPVLTVTYNIASVTHNAIIFGANF